MNRFFVIMTAAIGIFAGTIWANDTAAVGTTPVADTAITVVMHNPSLPEVAPAEGFEHGAPAMAALPVQTEHPDAANSRHFKPAKVGEVLGILVPAAVLVGLFFMPTAQ